MASGKCDSGLYGVSVMHTTLTRKCFSYVHGVMDGEVIKGVKRGAFTYSNFVLE